MQSQTPYPVSLGKQIAILALVQHQEVLDWLL
jgi:hypothetical protein